MTDQPSPSGEIAVPGVSTDALVPQGTVSPQILTILPPDWFYKESITILAPDGGANVIASSEPISRDLDTDSYARVQGDLLKKEFPGYLELSFEPTELLGGPGWLRVFEWNPPDGSPVSQMQVYGVKDGRGFTATATTTLDRYGDFEIVFRDVLQGLSLRRSQ
jgi:hypothetical protein